MFCILERKAILYKLDPNFPSPYIRYKNDTLERSIITHVQEIAINAIAKYPFSPHAATGTHYTDAYPNLN